jgi:hypothetical protein
MASGAKRFAIMLLTISTDAARPTGFPHHQETSVVQVESNISRSLRDSDDHIFEDDAHFLLQPAVPPKEQVEAAVAAAGGHAEMTKAAAFETQANISKEMEDAVKRGEMVDMSLVTRMNDAIKRDRTAQELVAMTGDYTGKVHEFFEAIERRSTSIDQRNAAQKQMDAEQKEEELRLSMIKETKAAEHAVSEEARQAALAALEQSERELEQTLEEQRQAMADLKNSHNLQEILEAEQLMGLFGTIQMHDGKIKEKDATIEANIHPTVKEATNSVKTWANCEVKPFCKKFRKSQQVIEANPQANCKQAMEILIPIAKDPSGRVDVPKGEPGHTDCKIEEGHCQCS